MAARPSGAQSDPCGEGCALLIFVVMIAGLAVWQLTWLIEHPVGFVPIATPILLWSLRIRRKRLLAAYKTALDYAFVTTQDPPSGDTLAALQQQQQALPKSNAARRAIHAIEADVYEAVLDRVLDDRAITSTEAAIIASSEQMLSLDPATRMQIKKEIFFLGCVETIRHHRISKADLDNLRDLVAGLAIPPAQVQGEFDLLEEIIDTQKLRPPLEPIPSHEVAAQTQKGEDTFYQCPAQVLSKRQSDDSLTGDEYTVERDGTMLVTNKRVIVVGEGTTNIRYDDIVDLVVDVDARILEISKRAPARPIFLKTEAPIYTGRHIELRINA